MPVRGESSTRRVVIEIAGMIVTDLNERNSCFGCAQKHIAIFGGAD